MAGGRGGSGELARQGVDRETGGDALPSLTVAAELKSLKARLFVDREDALGPFAAALSGEPHEWRVLNIYGSSGLGKSSVLDAYRRLAEEHGAFYVYANGEALASTREAFTDRICHVLGLAQFPGRLAAGECIRLLHKQARRRPVVLALDGYESLADIDQWLREWFLVRLPAGVLVVIASYGALEGRWRESDAWRRLVLSVRLRNFDVAQTKEYLRRHGVSAPGLVDALWRFSGGHPRALSLGLSVITREGEEQANALWERPEVVGELAGGFLREVREEALAPLARAAAVTHRFDHGLLSHVTGAPIERHRFMRLVNTSFIHRDGTAWAVEEVAGKAIRLEVKWSSAAEYARLRSTARSYWARLATSRRNAPEGAGAVGDLLYFSDDEMLRALLHPAGVAGAGWSVVRMRLDRETVERLLAAWRVGWDLGTPPRLEFTDPETGLRFDCTPSPIDLRRQREWMRLWGASAAGDLVAHLLRNQTATPCGLAVVGHAAGADGRRERRVYLICTADPGELGAWSALLRDLSDLALEPGELRVATPLPFLQSLLARAGFTDGAEDAASADSDPLARWWARTVDPSRLGRWVLETAGDGPAPPLGPDEDAPATPARPSVAGTPNPAWQAIRRQLTLREREIALAVFEGLSNAAIAARFHVTEATVKKHLTHVFEKTQTKSRTQLISRMR